MASFSSLFPSKLLSSINPRERPSDPLAHLRFTLETMPGSRKYIFTPTTRAEILSELYDAFWGQFAHLFLPNPNSGLPLHATLGDIQHSLGFAGAGRDDQICPGRPCGRIFKRGESCFRCKDCSLDDSCVLCSRCFHATDHKDHQVSFFIAQQSGGCCDCGDEEAWRVPIGCPFHPPAPQSEIPEPRFQPPKTLAKAALGIDPPPVKNYPYRVPVPFELRETMSRTIGYAFDFMLDTLDYSPDEPSIPLDEAELRLQPSSDPMGKDQFCILIWNDDKHSFDEVIRLICDMTGRSREEADEMACRIDDQGRDVIDMSSNITRLLEIAQTFSQIDIGVTVRRAYDTFREQVVTVIIEWLSDLTRSRLGTDALVLRELIAQELLAPRRRDTNSYSTNPQAPNVVSGVYNPTRLDWLFLYHTKLWKKPRLSMKEMYATILTLSREHKLAVAGRFSNVYHRVIDAYLLVDREAETSIKYFALQLFTVPSVGYHVVRHHNIVSRILAIITAFFTNQIEGKHITFPANTSVEVEVDSFPFKSKRFMPVFSDLRYLCHNEPVQKLIAHNHDFIAEFAKVCQLFMCINPNKRAATSHVEYETDAWISVFNVTLSLSRVVKVYGEAFIASTTAELVAAISTVIHHILLVCTMAHDLRRDRNRFPAVVFHKVNFAGAGYTVVKFDVAEGWVSFHHALHWLLAELLKHVHLLTSDRLREFGRTSLREVILRTANAQAIQTVMDYPLRVLAMIAQIRTGLWVRNGFAIRGQLMHYRDFMLRELCYDQDLYVLQASLVILDRDTVMVSILDRFGLLGFFSGAFLHSTYEGPQLCSMVEEVLYVFITMLSETGNASRMPLPTAVRREIVHALAMGPCTFADLVKRVAERLVDDVSFERVLKEVARFKFPESITDSGMYELNDECFDEVNPFFYHYTRNKREEVDAKLRARLKKVTGVADPVIVPKRFGVENGPFAEIPSSFESVVLLQVMFYSFYNILLMTDNAGNAPASGEAILDQAMHLVMLAIVERGAFFSSLAVQRTFEENKSLVDILCIMEHHAKFKPYKSRIDWALRQMEIHIPQDIQARRQVDNEQEMPPDPEQEKKRAANARKDAILKQMKEQQASFAVNFDDTEDYDDEDMEEPADEHATFGNCIVCQEDLTAARPFGTLGLIQASRLVRRHPDSHISFLNEVLQTPSSMDRASKPVDTTFPPPNADNLDAKWLSSPNFEGFPAQYTRFGLQASICSHMMHLDCFHVYSVSIRQRHRAQATRNHPEVIPRKEYICPLCKSLGNVILPVGRPSTVPLSTVPFPDWIRAAGISILKSRPDTLLDSLQFRNGTGEFVFWSAQDAGFPSVIRAVDRSEWSDMAKMVETVMMVSKSFSQQTRHLRDRPEPDVGERGAGIYLPEELVGYTIAAIEIAQRGTDVPVGLGTDNFTESQGKMIRGMLMCLTKLAALHFRGRPDEGREAIRQAIIKRLLPEWSRTSLTSFSYPLLLRDPFTVLVETAAVSPEMLRHVLVLTYYACLARTVIGLVYVLNKTRSYSTVMISRRAHEDIFGDVRMFFMSVVRHSPVFEHTATLVFETFGEARIEKLLYAFTLPFLRRAAILCHAVLPLAFPTPSFTGDPCEYNRLLMILGIPPLSDLPNQDTLQNALSGWCAHYGHSHAASQLNCGVVLDFPAVYRLARMPLILDNLFGSNPKALTCPRCNTIPVDAAICLICGVMCCMQSHCCTDNESNDRGECNMHMRECGGSVGIFFLAKRCSLLYLHANNGTFAQSPYLDVHGEVDVAMRRGRRQYLHQPRWEDIRRIWLSHGIPTVVARKLESSVDSGGWEML